MSNTDLATLSSELEKLKAEVAELRETVGKSEKENTVETRPLPDAREFTAPPEMHEWVKYLRSHRKNPEDMVIAIGGMLERPNNFSVWRRVVSQSNWFNQPATDVAMAISPLAHEARWELMKALFLLERSAGELQEMTGLVGGQFYHHLKELALGGYISQKERGRYTLSSKGTLLFATLMSLISVLSDMTRQAEEKLVMPEDIEE